MMPMNMNESDYDDNDSDYDDNDSESDFKSDDDILSSLAIASGRVPKLLVVVIVVVICDDYDDKDMRKKVCEYLFIL